MEKENSVVGKRLPRPDGIAKVTGKAEYPQDIELPGMLIGRILRSPYAHAKIVDIDVSRAKDLPGVEAIITHQDVPKNKYNRSTLAMALPPPLYAEEVHDEYILNDKVRYVGEPVAAVAASDIYTAERALDLIEVKYDILPPVFNPEDAMNSESSLIHEGHEQNIALSSFYPFNCGNIEKGLMEADHVAEFKVSTSKQKAAQFETDTTVAKWDADGKVTIWSSSENPHLAKHLLGKEIFGIPEGRIRVITPTVGGGFGPRLSLMGEPLCMMLSKVSGRPVKLVYTREEDFVAHDGRTKNSQNMRVGVKEDGTITCIEQKIVSHAGAYLSHSASTTGINMLHTLPLFRCENVLGEMTVVYSNTPTCGGMRGYGNPEGAFALQQTIDIAAEKIGMDPLEFRMKNARGVGEPSLFVPIPLESCGLEECMRKGAEAIGWDEKWGGWKSRKRERKMRGVGMGIATIACGPGGFLLEQSNASISLDADGSAKLVVAPCEMGQGILGALSQIAAEELGIPYKDIHIITGDTDVTLFDIGSHASRSVVVVGNAVAEAARKVKKQLFDLAAKELGVASDDLRIEEGKIYVENAPGKEISVAEISGKAIYNFDRTQFQISATGSFHPGTMSPTFQASFVEVEVDTETGIVEVIKYVIAHDIGRAINPMNVEGQLEGAFVQSLGLALFEDFILDENSGETITADFANYKIPSILDVPEIETILVEEENPRNYFGAKGVGESGTINVASAIANAIYDAVGLRIDTLPITPEKVLKALNNKA